MKTPIAITLLAAPLLLALPAAAGPPTIVLSTPALNLNSNIVIIGTAADTPETVATDGKAALAGVREVRYQIEGSRKWRKAQLTGKNASSTGWMVPYENKSAVGKRILFYAVDRSGNGSAVISARFKKTTTTATTTPPTTPVAPITPIVTN